MTLLVWFGSPADAALLVVKLLLAGLLIGLVAVGLWRVLSRAPRPSRRTDVRRSDARFAAGRARVVWPDDRGPDLHQATTANLLASARRARR